MAIQYVGGNTGTWAGATSGDNTVSLTALTGGISSSAAIGDLVIAAYSTGSTVNRTLAISTGYTDISGQLYANGSSYDSNLFVAYKYLTSADTTTTFGPTGSGSDAGAAAVYVFRGVSPAALDVPDTTNTGTGTGRPTPPAITPVTAGTFIVCVGAGAAATGAVFTTATLSAFRSVTSSDTNDSTIGIGYFQWTSGTYTPAQFSGGTTNSVDSWTAVTIALRTPATFGSAVSETATVTESSTRSRIVPVSASETATSTDSTSATRAYPGALTETAVATESATALKTVSAALAEPATATESLSAAGSTYNVAAAETATATQSAVGGLAASRDVTETATAVESVFGGVVLPTQAVAESVALQDAIVANNSSFYVSLAETTLLSDSVVCRLLWELIDDSQTANWQNADDAQAPGWSVVSTSQDPNWTSVGTL